jgi:hypothetical protein
VFSDREDSSTLMTRGRNCRATFGSFCREGLRRMGQQTEQRGTAGHVHACTARRPLSGLTAELSNPTTHLTGSTSICRAG